MTAHFNQRKLHFIGIGGAGMSALALISHWLGAQVTGSDRSDSAYCEPLRAVGIEPQIGHDASNVVVGSEVVVSTAISQDNPELEAAHRAGMPVIHRGDLLAEVSRLKRVIAVSGTHGKTTTAAMAAHILLACGHDPAYIIGGELRSTGANAGWSDGEWLIVEADESDRSFLKLSAEACVVTSIELDHHATYPSSIELERAFFEFASPCRTRIFWENLDLALEACSYGVGERADLRARDIELYEGGSRFVVADTKAELGVAGQHNVLNALGALAVSRVAGCDLTQAVAALRGFQGTGRRFESKGRTASGCLVFDDYGHHPTEVRATLEAARSFKDLRVICCFQPHLYSRTRWFAREFGTALALADVVVVCDVYPARERAEDFPGVSGWLVAQAAADAAQGRPVYWAPSLEEARRLLGALVARGDLLLTVGAGNVGWIADELIQAPGASKAVDHPQAT
jgi:UDP-N-acetylmuramate--alanine ligase